MHQLLLLLLSVATELPLRDIRLPLCNEVARTVPVPVVPRDETIAM